MAVSKAQQSDTHNIKGAMPSYILFSLKDHLEPPVLPKDKLTQGFHHSQFAHMLCPVSLLEKFDENPQ